VGSVVYFPGIVYDFFEELEEMFPVEKIIWRFYWPDFSRKIHYRTAQSPIMNSLKLKTENPDTAPEAVRDMLRQANK